MKWLVKILVWFDRHPWDWLAHIFLGLIVFIGNLSVLRTIDFLWYPMSIELIQQLTIIGTINFVIAVELTQWDILGISWRIILDSFLDFWADMVGILIGIWIFG